VYIEVGSFRAEASPNDVSRSRVTTDPSDGGRLDGGRNRADRRLFSRGQAWARAASPTRRGTDQPALVLDRISRDRWKTGKVSGGQRFPFSLCRTYADANLGELDPVLRCRFFPNAPGPDSAQLRLAAAAPDFNALSTGPAPPEPLPLVDQLAAVLVCAPVGPPASVAG
jgi:hypothetical protein